MAKQPVWPSLESLQTHLQRWQQEQPRVLALETPGQSLQGRLPLLARLTDPDGDVEDRECVLQPRQSVVLRQSVGVTTP